MQASAKYLVGWGNVFWWVGSNARIEFLRSVPLEVIADRGIKTNAQGEITKIILEWDRDPKEILGDELIYLPYNVLTAKPFGIGILQSFCTSLDIGNGETREPFYQIKSKVHSGMAGVIEKFGGPVELWSLPGLHKDKVQEAQSLVSRIPRKGARFVYGPPAGSEAKVQPVIPEITRGLERYLEMLDDEYLIGLQSPISNLLGKSGFKYATAKAAVEVVENRIMALQRFLKRGVERYLFDRVLAQAGLDPKQAQVRLNWGMQESLDYEKLTQLLAQLIEIFAKVGPDVITAKELRKILRDVAKLPLEEKPPEEPFEKVAKPLVAVGEKTFE